MNPIEKYFINQKSFDEAMEDDAMFDIDFSNYENNINNNFPNDDEVIENEPNFSNLFDKDGFQAPLPKQEYLNGYQDDNTFDKKNGTNDEVPSIENKMNGTIILFIYLSSILLLIGLDQAELLIPGKPIFRYIFYSWLIHYSELNIIENTQYKIKELFKLTKSLYTNIQY
jgi:hypothetical protein